MADVNVAIGVGRAIVQDKARAACAGLADLLVEFLLLPGRDPLRLALGEVATHREGCVGKVKCVFVVSHSGYSMHEVVFCGVDITGDLGLQSVEVGEFRFVA